MSFALLIDEFHFLIKMKMIVDLRGGESRCPLQAKLLANRIYRVKAECHLLTRTSESLTNLLYLTCNAR